MRNRREMASTRPVGVRRIDGCDTAMAIFENMYEDFECIVTKSNFSFQAICKVQPLCHVHKLLAATANSMFCVLCSLSVKLKRQQFCLLSSAS